MSRAVVAKVIAGAAARHLRPLGFTRKGRSRLWLWDRRWFLIVVEFQPHSWDLGTFLNVGANFLWRPKEHLSFDLGHRVGGFHPFQSEEQFRVEVEALAETAATTATELDRDLESFDGAARALTAKDGPWALFDRAAALGLSGDGSGAVGLLDQLAAGSAPDDPPALQALRRTARELAAIAPDRRELAAHLSRLNEAHRALLRLVAAPDPFGAAAPPPA